MLVRVVIDYVVMRFLNFVIEHLLQEHENERKTVFACSYGAKVESLKQNTNGRKYRDTVPLKQAVSRSNFVKTRLGKYFKVKKKRFKTGLCYV